MGQIGSLTSFSVGGTAKASEVNANFSEIKTKVNSYGMWTDTICTVTVSHTFSASQTFSAGISLTGTLTMATAASKLVPGATSFSIRNNADDADNLLISNAGAVTVRNGLTVASGTITGTLATAAQGNVTSLGTLTGLTCSGAITTATLSFSGSAPKLLSGATGFDLRNNADSRSFLDYNDETAVTLGNTSISATMTGSTIALSTGGLGNIVLGAITATDATTGFVVLSAYNTGVPTGAASNGALYIDATNNRLYVRVGGAWKYASLT